MVKEYLAEYSGTIRHNQIELRLLTENKHGARLLVCLDELFDDRHEGVTAEVFGPPQPSQCCR